MISMTVILFVLVVTVPPALTLTEEKDVTTVTALAHDRDLMSLPAGMDANDNHCERPVRHTGCTIVASHARCQTWNFAASVQALPSCVTRLTFSLLAKPQDYNSLFTIHDIWLTNFTGLPQMKEMSIFVNKEDYINTRINFPQNGDFIHQLPNLRVLRVRAACQPQVIGTNIQMFQQLQVLEFTRARLLNFDFVSSMIGAKPSMKTLILRNIQQLHGYNYSLSVDLSSFICGGQVTYLDLSYNDIVTVHMKFKCRNSNLRYFRADHNLFASGGNGDEFLNLYPALSKLVGVHASVWSEQIYQKNLWIDEGIMSDVDTSIDTRKEDQTKPSSLSAILQHLPYIGEFAGYDFWLREFMKHCGDFGYLDILRCSSLDPVDLCPLFHCLVPQFDLTMCQALPEDSTKMNYIGTNICSFKSCLYSIRIPVPPNLTTFVFHDFGKFGHILDSFSWSNKTFCIHPNNQVQTIDLRNIYFDPLQSIPSEPIRISGLHKLRSVNIQGHRLPYSLDKFVLSDADSLTELHIGGSRVAQNNIFANNVIQTYTHLTLLNLSGADLLGLESDVFLVHKNLSVLDLSYNRLSSSSLVSLDLSQMKLKSLNLSHNQLSSMPASVRDHLDSMPPGLDLYLSGNGFLCNCDNLEFLQWIQSSSSRIFFHYAGDHVCADSPDNTIHNIEIDSLHCDWFWVRPVLAVGSTLVVSLLTLAVYAVYRNRWRIANLIFRFRERFCSIVSDGDSTMHSYTYDAFVLYSSVDEDRLWVHYKLVQELENVYGFRLCVHHRDFLIGHDIVENIETAIRRSRKVLVVMSPNFLRSQWCREEVQMTVNVDPQKLIVLMYKDVLMSGAPIPQLLQRLLQRTYIEWEETDDAGQALFWKKMRGALYSKHMAYREEVRPTILLPDDIALV